MGVGKPVERAKLVRSLPSGYRVGCPSILCGAFVAPLGNTDGSGFQSLNACRNRHGKEAIMRLFSKNILVVAIILASMASSGCNLLSIPYFLFFMPDPKTEAEIQKIAAKDKKTEKKVLILTYGKLDLRPELLNSDREIAYNLEKHLKLLTSANSEKVTVIPARKAEEYKSTHPDWLDRDPAEVGKHFKADYVIYIEVNSLSIYEHGSGGTLYRGRADINITLIDVNNPDESHPPRNFTCAFPREARMQITSTDQSPMEFRQTFLDYVGRRLSWKFTAHPTRDDFYAD